MADGDMVGLLAVSDIRLTVLSNLSLGISPQVIGRDAENNSSIFRIVEQPTSLDSYVCRAEVQTPNGVTYRLVENGMFRLTSDMTIAGTNYLQLVYSDGADILIKTTVAHFTITRSINAVDRSDPEFSDGLAQLQSAAFTSVQSPGPPGYDVATFSNISGQPVGILHLPPLPGGGIDEETANALFLRLDGSRPMTGSIGFTGPARGIVWGDSGLQGAMYSTGSELVMRRPINDLDIMMEDNSGAAASRSPILTEAMGDTRYLTPNSGDARYLQLSGGSMTGPLISRSGGSLTNPGIGIGDNSTGFYKTGNFLVCTNGGAGAWQASPTTGLSVFGALDMQNNRVSAVADPTNAQDAVNVRTFNAAIEGLLTQAMADARYLQLAGGTLTGPLVGTAITGTSLTITGNSNFNGPVALTQTPFLPTDATPKSYVDGLARAPAVVYNFTADVEVPPVPAAPPNDWTTVATVPISITRPGPANVQVTASLRIVATGSVAANLNSISIRVPGVPARRAWYYGNADIEATLYTVMSGPSTNSVEVQVRLETPVSLGTLTVVGTGPDLSQICLQDLGPAAAEAATAQAA